MVVGTAKVNGEPVPTSVPPQLPVYQVRVPPVPPLAVSTIFPVELLHIVGLSTDMVVGTVVSVFTVTTVLIHADAGVQPATSLLTK